MFTQFNSRLSLSCSFFGQRLWFLGYVTISVAHHLEGQVGSKAYLRGTFCNSVLVFSVRAGPPLDI
jgi:hypothetical protein